MKFYLLSALIIIAFFAACKKGDDAAKPAASQADSISQANSISQATPANPPVAKYVGTMIANARFGGTCDAPYPQDDTNLSFIYCVAVVKSDASISFWMQNPLIIYGIDSAVSICGTFPENTQNSYGVSPLNNNSFIFKIVNDSLYVNGYYSVDYNSFQYDYDGHVVVRFAGKFQPDTATVQAKQRNG